jgi:hypothetical protein
VRGGLNPDLEKRPSVDTLFRTSAKLGPEELAREFARIAKRFPSQRRTLSAPGASERAAGHEPGRPV